MQFALLLLLANLICFLPLYALNFRDAPNPLGFLSIADRSKRTWLLRPLYERSRSPDPFRINFDFTFFVLMGAAAGLRAPGVLWCGTALLAFGIVEIFYTTLMHSVFKRAPALSSDLSLLRSGLKLAQRQAYWMLPAALGALVGITYASYALVSRLFRHLPENDFWPLAAALLLIPPCFYHWRAYEYSEFLWRAVYSPLLHLHRNLLFVKRVKAVLAKDAAHFERHNFFKRVQLSGAPNVVIVCVESYGSVAHREPRFGTGIQELLRGHETQLARDGYRFASTHSEAPLFAGGSWLSYASFTYGLALTDLQLFDGLFSHASNFACYESLFHVLKRNGYENVLLCPLGGVDSHAVDWASLDRCFQTQHKIAFEDLGYGGPLVNYLGLVRRYSALDQYSLNFGYERARRDGRHPFCLFFCTLNSHYPWHAGPRPADDWRTLNHRGLALPNSEGDVLDRYSAAIRYQLDYILRFVHARSTDAPLVVVFGDHQPPIITPESMGKQTPVHVLSRNQALIDVFLETGFAPRLDLAGTEPRAMRHEGFLSLLMKAMQAAYGTAPGLDVDYREHGAALLDELLEGGARAAS